MQIKPSNYYTQNIATIIEANKATGEQITIQLSCGRAKTKTLNYNIDLLYAIVDLHKHLVKAHKSQFPVMKDKRYGFELLPAGSKQPLYEVAFCNGVLGHRTLLQEAVELAQQHKDNFLNGLNS